MFRFSKESANTILIMLLDKQPRWLRPRDVEDAIRRMSQLDRPPTPMGNISDSNRTPPPPLSLPSEEDHSSADEPATEVREILSKYPESYAELVQDLISRYSTSVNHFAGSQSTSVQEAMGEISWSHDRQQADPFDGKPYPLPGDFLRLDSSETCDLVSEGHRKRWCLCIARTELFNALFITSAGPTPLGRRLIEDDWLSFQEGGLQDAFGNTILHLLAIRNNIDSLRSFLLHQKFGSGIINNQNSAGQTFLHAFNFQQLNLDRLCEIIDWLVKTEYVDGSKFDFSLRDHYGRSFFHVLAAVVQESAARPILEKYSPIVPGHRDAFNIRLAPGDEALPEAASYPDSSDEQASAFSGQIRRMQLIQHSWRFPRSEDEEGSNGLHLLASVILSKSSMESYARLGHQRSSSDRRGQEDADPLDSSHDRMHARLEMVEGALQSGVDPNHYDCQGYTPLMAFVAQLPEDDDYKTGPQILDLLIKHGANVHWRNRSGETALLVAARCGKKLAVRTLIENGANVHARDASGRGVLTLLDGKTASALDNPIQYAHYEACRAYLSGSKGNACREPTLMQEWGIDPSQVEGA